MVLEEGYWSQSIIKKDSLGYEYCYIPDSTFLYGKNRMPSRIHAPFYMAKFPVTVEQYKRFVKETSYDYDLFDIMEQLSPKSDCPATPLSWQNAKAYARWLRSTTGEYYSLPSEEEWEIAARGTDGRLYPWGNTLPMSDGKNVDLTPKRLQTSPVGSQPLSVSPFGCMDIVGNVWEWCLDDIDDLGEAHIMRGASCINAQDYCHCNARSYESPSDKRVLYSGFRVIYLPEELYKGYSEAIEKSRAAPK